MEVGLHVKLISFEFNQIKVIALENILHFLAFMFQTLRTLFAHGHHLQHSGNTVALPNCVKES